MRAPRRQLTIRFRLGLALALALLPVLLLGAFESYRSFRSDAAQREQALHQAALRAAVGARGQVQGAEALLRSLSPQTVGLSCPGRLSEALDDISAYENLLRLDANGRVACAAATVGPDPVRKDAPWFQQLAKGEPLVIADAPPGLYGRAPAILAAVPAGGAGQAFAGALIAVIRLDRLRPDLKDTTLAADTQVGFLGPEGRVVGATRTGAFALPPKNWREAATRPRGLTYTARDAEGAMRVHTVSPLLGQRLFVILSSPAPGLASFARLNPLTTVILPLLAWLFAWAAVSIVTERLVIRWLAYLDRIASIYAKGRFTVRPVQAESAPAEIRALAQTLDSMADGLVARDASLRESLTQKDAMMREIHHRVKNNLQVITSLLNMQQRTLTDPAARAAMSDTRQRIGALALIYRALYQSPDLKRVDVRQFLEELTAQLSAGEGGSSGRVRSELDADDLEIDPDKLAPLALFAVEAITNARKHAFDEAGGTIHVRFRVEEREIVLEIEDDGAGDQADAAAQGGVGSTLMSAFARQLRGRHEITSVPERGVLVRLTFPRPDLVAASQEPEQQAAA